MEHKFNEDEICTACSLSRTYSTAFKIPCSPAPSAGAPPSDGRVEGDSAPTRPEGDSLVVMSKELRDAPLTQIATFCPTCKDELVLSIRVANGELAAGLISKRMQNAIWRIEKVVERFCGIKSQE